MVTIVRISRSRLIHYALSFVTIKSDMDVYNSSARPQPGRLDRRMYCIEEDYSGYCRLYVDQARFTAEANRSATRANLNTAAYPPRMG